MQTYYVYGFLNNDLNKNPISEYEFDSIQKAINFIETRIDVNPNISIVISKNKLNKY